MNTKRFIKEFKSSDKEERVTYIEEHLKELIDYMLSGEFNNNPYKQDLYELILSKKFAKAVKKYTRMYDAPANLVLLITDSIGSGEISSDNKEVISIYIEILKDVLSKRCKKLMKITNLPDYVCYNVLTECPEKIDNDKTPVQFTFIKRVIRKLYVIDKVIDDQTKDDIEENKNVKAAVITPSTLLKLLKEVLGENVLDKITSYILLENRDNRNICAKSSEASVDMWDAITRCGLMLLNYSGGKKDIAEWIKKFYISKRKKANDLDCKRERRIALSDVTEDEAPSVYKAVKYIKEDEDNDKIVDYLD